MNSSVFLHVAVERELHDEQIQKLQRERLGRAAAHSDRKNTLVFPRLMIWLGSRLVVWGSKLQNRYQSMLPQKPSLNRA